jgi:hypothetical protein
MIGILALVVGLLAFICQILVLMKMLPEEGVLKTILGFICGLYALIWGWQNADRLNIKKLMQIWTALIVIGLVLNALVRASA